MISNTNSGILFACGVFCLYPLLAAALGAWLYDRYQRGYFRRSK